MKSFTDIEQSKKLAEILPIESADMWWPYYYDVVSDTGEYDKEPMLHKPVSNPYKAIPCWSLSALLDILYPNGITLDYTKGEGWSIITNIVVEKNPNPFLQGIFTEEVIAETPIDACVEMIIKLYKGKND